MKKIKELRNEHNITMKKLGEIVGVSESAISQYENGKRQPDIETLKVFADFFNVSIDYLLGKSDLRSPLDIPEHIEGIANLVLRMRSDDEFSDIINKINELSPEQLKAISTILSSMN